MDFFVLRKNKVLFSIYLGFEVFVKSTNFEFCEAIIDFTAYEKLIAVSWDLLIFGGWYLLCLVDPIHIFKKVDSQKFMVLGKFKTAWN